MKGRPSQPETRKARLSDYFPMVPLVLLAILLLSVFVPIAASAAGPATITSFDIPGAVTLVVTGIDGAGLIVGTYFDSSNVFHGFTRDADGAITVVDAPGAGNGFDQGTYIAGVSSAGQIAGSYADSGSREHGFWLGPSGTIITFDAPNSDSTFATGINDSGQVAGFYYYNGFPAGPFGFIWTNSGPTVTFEPANNLFLYSARINSFGDVAGFFENTLGKGRAYYRDVNGNFTVFSPSPPSGNIDVTGINDSSTIVGYFVDEAGAAEGFIREGSRITQVSVSGAAETYINSVNGVGTVAGHYVDANGVSHGFSQDRFGNVTVIDVSYAGTGAGQGTFATTINAIGEVAGYFVGPLGNMHGFLRR